jgi:PEP-CTERM motif
MPSSRIVFAALLSAFAAQGLAQTTILPAAQYQLGLRDPGYGTFTGSVPLDPNELAVLSHSYADSTGMQTVATAQVSQAGIRPIVQVQGDARFGSNRALSLFATASMDYFFAVSLVDPTRSDLADIPIPVIVNSRLDASAFADAGSFGVNTWGSGSVAIPDFDIHYSVIAFGCPDCGPVPDVDAFNAISASANTSYRVQLYAEGSAANGGLGDPATHAGFQVIADPLFQIDPAFAYRDSFRIEYSDNLFAAAAVVPEPQSYALLLAGLGLLGFAARRKA